MKEKTQTHPVAGGGGGCRSPLCVCLPLSRAGKQRGWPGKMEREICKETQRMLERRAEDFRAASPRLCLVDH